MLHLHECPDHNLTYSLNLRSGISHYIFLGTVFHIFGPRFLNFYHRMLLFSGF